MILQASSRRYSCRSVGSQTHLCLPSVSSPQQQRRPRLDTAGQVETQLGKSPLSLSGHSVEQNSITKSSPVHSCRRRPLAVTIPIRSQKVVGGGTSAICAATLVRNSPKSTVDIRQLTAMVRLVSLSRRIWNESLHSDSRSTAKLVRSPQSLLVISAFACPAHTALVSARHASACGFMKPSTCNMESCGRSERPTLFAVASSRRATSCSSAARMLPRAARARSLVVRSRSVSDLDRVAPHFAERAEYGWKRGPTALEGMKTNLRASARQPPNFATPGRYALRGQRVTQITPLRRRLCSFEVEVDPGAVEAQPAGCGRRRQC
eukprot:scaffold31485_cov57-Phaeocystis_antarctica.AAC.6